MNINININESLPDDFIETCINAGAKIEYGVKKDVFVNNKKCKTGIKCMDNILNKIFKSKPMLEERECTVITFNESES